MNKGQIHASYTVTCGICDDTKTKSNITKEQAVHFFKSIGWNWTIEYGWVCRVTGSDYVTHEER